MATPATTRTTVTGRVIKGYGDHGPISDLPLWIGAEAQGEPATRTDLNGRFILTSLPAGKTQVVGNHLAFQVLITSPQATVDLGSLKYPLIHPPNYYWWTAAPLPDLSVLLTHGESVAFSVCLTQLDWQRPPEQTQRQTVWSQLPFSAYPTEQLRRWFEQPAVLYDSIDRFSQSFPGGPYLDEPGTDWRYLLGLWTGPDLVALSRCAYDGPSLEDLLARRQIEVWLIGYEATRVQQLDKGKSGYDESASCDPAQRGCTQRPGHHFAVHVSPLAGYQVIRFAGVEDVLAVHIIEDGQELLVLPEQF